ncbi:sulfatase-like hydrolase/transferase [Pontiella agarivorans]|uniref:Sulfatase-like hydrolase/transferase n=1 Tax=Pontiella agarivorans TaxID=3038953 RepID=A0ABU5MYT9_9BACT|nr:sulfatase-like hydrolase/transferase [Pontiella agarivorans]MDZ8119141.1 sulfatase-like hydrolase/transferase [Pontiella agarivorans]
MRKRLRTVLLAALTVGGFVWGAEKPNVVIILADDLGYGDVGFTGSTEIPTPNLDRMAREGVICTQGYVTHPYCAPTRAGLMSGRYQQRFGFEVNPAYDPHNAYDGIPKSEKTIATRMKEAGYKTGMVGKWHLGAHANFHPNNRGFDFFCGFTGGGHDYFRVDMRQIADEGYLQPIDRNGAPLEVDGYLTRQLTDEAIGFIERNHKSPFFLYVAYNAPHAPLQAPKESIEKFSHLDNPLRATYAAMVYEMDRGIGRLMDSLNNAGLGENTLVFFLSDNGGPKSWDKNKPFASNGPFRGHKGDLYDGGVHVPFMAYWPGRIAAGRVFDQPVVSLDIPRTAAVLAGADESGLEGQNILPQLSGKTERAPHDAIYFRRRNGVAWSIVSANKTKLIKNDWDGTVELFDLTSDESEENNLVGQQPEKQAELLKKWKKWNEKNIDFQFSDFHPYHKQLDEFYKTMPSK